MKDERNKYIKNLAKRIVKAEQEIQMGKNVKENQDKIEKLMCSLSINDLFKLETYISEKKMLTR